MSALKYLDPFPFLIVSGVVVLAAVSLSVAAPAWTSLVGRLLVTGLGLAVIVVAGLWVWRTLNDQTSE